MRLNVGKYEVFIWITIKSDVSTFSCSIMRFITAIVDSNLRFAFCWEIVILTGAGRPLKISGAYVPFAPVGTGRHARNLYKEKIVTLFVKPLSNM